ncbi:MAG TPA: ATP-binding protein [Terriglobales bacterium]|jgi:signal transduction histidine kinase
MRKQKQLELKSEPLFSGVVGKKLFLAREEERRKIARELHDAFGQELVTILLELNQLAKNCKSLAPQSNLSRQVCNGLDDLSTRVNQIASSINEVSHQLHSTILERAGLRLALEQLCADLSARGRTQVYFVGTGLKTIISPSVSLCLYRIAQEALHNVDKHAHAPRTEVILKELGHYIVLTVRDHGVGYNQRHLNSNAGLGLSSMEERAVSMGGAFALKTALGKGTEVTVQLPLKNRN